MSSRAGRYTRILTLTQAQTYRDDEKAVVDGSMQWFTDVRGAMSHLRCRVVCGAQTMTITGEDRGPGNVQIRIQIPGAAGNLGRLCWTPGHGDNVHWHWWDHMVGLDPDPKNVTMGVPSRDLMTEEFVTRLRIIIQEELPR